MHFSILLDIGNLVAYKVVVSWRRYVADNTERYRKIGVLHSNEQHVQAKLRLVCVVYQNVVLCISVFPEFDSTKAESV